ncbi:MAG: SCO family protein [Verrucomicrobiota bacterium]
MNNAHSAQGYGLRPECQNFVQLSVSQLSSEPFAAILSDMKFGAVIPFLVLSLIWTSCKEQPAAKPPTALAQTNVQTFQVKGVVKKIEPDGTSILIQHEAIPNYMVAMTMPFDVKNTNEVASLQPGDSIGFRLNVTDEDSWIDQIQKIAASPGNVEPPPKRDDGFRRVRDVEPLDIGDVMPEYRFTNELGRAVSLSDFRGKALVFTFIFTRCPMPEFCPLMSRSFAATARILTNNPAAPKNWHLLSISFDPDYDTPAVLKNYAEAYGYDPARWSFVTGALIDIDAITEQFSLPIVKRGNDWDHKLRTVVVDVNGKIQNILVGNQWKPQELADEIIKAAQVPPRDG